MDSQEEPYLGDMQIVARHLTPTEAHMLCSCLQAAGVPAQVGDVHLVQMHALLAGAVGGACVRVPSSCVAEAKEVVAAFERGDFSLQDDFDVDV
jgi:DNA-binding transcriptional regulator LsrR (DeoR family)